MKRSLTIVVAAACLAGAPAPQRFEASWDSLDARPMPSWFQDAKFGIFIHWGVYSVPAYAPVIPGRLAYAEWYWNAMTRGKGEKPDPIQAGTWAFHRVHYGPEFDYRDFAPQFRAELFDAAHWAAVFARSGARYVVPTSKHHEGFALWPSREASATWGRPWNAAEIGPRRDLLGELAKAVRAAGLRFGFYYSLYEWYNPLWVTDKPRYVREHMIPQFKDVVTRYEPSIIFSDGEWDLTSSEWRTPELLAWLFNESAARDEVVVNDRWGKDTRHKHGGYWTTEYTPGMAEATHAWEESRGMGYSYGYNRAERLDDYRTGRELVTSLVDIVSRGGNLLLDIGPAADGTIPVVMEQRLAEIGAWLAVNGEAIYGTRPFTVSKQWSEGRVPSIDFNKEYNAAYDLSKLVGEPSGGNAAIEAFFTRKGDAVYAILPRWPGRRFLWKGTAGPSPRTISLLGAPGSLRFTRRPAGSGSAQPGGAIEVELPELTEALRGMPMWVLKLTR
jgi:alpha-L-fucosidase